MHEMGIKKRSHEDFDAAEATRVLAHIEGDLRERPVTTPTPKAPAHE